MDRAGLLYSGGKDSSLAALLLEDLYDLSLVTGTFGITDSWQHARRAAVALDIPFQRLVLDRSVAVEAVETMQADGYPRNGIQLVHDHALERIAADPTFAVVADGTRRDDRAPTVSRPDAQSLEDRHGVEYVAPLAGFGRSAIDSLVGRCLDVESGPSEVLPTADYEAELRVLLRERGGDAEAVFPSHVQSIVTDR